MSEEVQKQEEEVVVKSEPKKSDLPPGFKTYDEWVAEGNDPNTWRSPKHFQEYGDLIGTIKNLREEVRSLVNYNQKIEANAYQKALAELKSLQKQAAESGDAEGVARITEEIVKATAQTVPPTQQEIPAVSDFKSRNASWFNNNTAENAAMTAFAVAKESEIRSIHPNMPPHELLNLVEEHVKSTFPNKFNIVKSKPTPMADPATTAVAESKKKSKEVTLDSLPKELQTVFNSFKAINPKAKLETYVTEWKRLGILED